MEEKMEKLFSEVFYGMSDCDINVFMERFCPENNVRLYLYSPKDLADLLIDLDHKGYDVQCDLQTKFDCMFVKFYNNKKTAVVCSYDGSSIETLNSILDWDNIYEVLHNNKDAMEYMLNHTNADLTEEELNILRPTDKHQKAYDEARIALDEAIKALRECAEILHNMQF